MRRAVVSLREFRGRKALPPRRAAAAQAEGRATRPLRRRVHIPLYIDQRLGHDRRGDHTTLQQARNCRAGLRPPEQRLRMGASAEVIHEPEHRIPAYHRHGCKLLPIHRGIAAHGRPLWNQGHGQGQEFPVQIHRRTCQVGQNGKAVQTQHLLQQTIQPNLGARID